MTIKTRFINDVYNGDKKKYLQDRKKDYCKVQFEWACYIEYLYKDNQITQKQYDKATF